MPKLPDITLYIDSLQNRIIDSKLVEIELHRAFFSRSVEPSLEELAGLTVSDIRRLGKRIAIGLNSDQWLVIHRKVAVDGQYAAAQRA